MTIQNSHKCTLKGSIKFAALVLCCILICGLSGIAEAAYSDQVFQVQKKLSELGYDPGPVDGLWGKKTKKALEQFQYDRGLPVSGKLDKQTKEKLGLQKPMPGSSELAPLYSDTRGFRITAIDKATGQQKEIKLYNKSYAVIIGIDQYKNLPYDMQLSYAVQDAKGVAEILGKNFKFDKIITLYNKEATKDRIFRVLSGDLSKISKNDSVFVFWAGHGYTQKTDYGDLGYLVPFDGSFSESDLYKNISMTMIKDDISKRIPAKHIFFVMDACYSGLLVTKRGAARKTARDFDYIKEITKENVRQVLTAGNKNQEVLDGGPKGHSVFTGRFIEILENTDDFITAAEISNMVKEKVFSDAKARGHIQTPQYGELFGLGDYVFVPSLERKVEDTQAELAKLQNEKKRLEMIEKAALEVKDEMAKRQAELEKRAVEAKLLAEQLKQERLATEKKRREKEQAERIRREQELVKRKKETELKLAALKEEVEAKRKGMAKSDIHVLSPAATIREMRDIDAKIKEIKSAYRNELANAIVMISNQVNDKFKKAINAKKDEFESKSEFQARVERMRKEAGQEQTKRFVEMSKKIDDAYNQEVAPLIKTLKELSGQEFALMAQDLILELHQYNAKFNTYPVTIRSKMPYEGVIIYCSTDIPIPREEARIFKQHFQNNILRPKIRGNFQSLEFFRITQAKIIDDATNQKYSLFNSRFVDLGRGIIIDKKTNLLWSKDTNQLVESLQWKDTKARLKNLEIAGISGWRVPSLSEIKNMYSVFRDHEKHPFYPPKKGDWNSVHRYVYRGYFVQKGCFSFDGEIFEEECGRNFVWVVKDSEFKMLDDPMIRKYSLFYNRFVLLNDEIVFDIKTNLLWSKDTNQLVESLQWKDAKARLKNLEIAGISGWRVPSLSEIKNMYSVFRDHEKHPFIPPKKGDWNSVWKYVYRGYFVQKGCFSFDGEIFEEECGRNFVWVVR